MSLGTLRLFKLIFLFIFSTSLFATNEYNLNFKLIKKGMQDNNTLLVVGGIQGDEPGGFMAASLLVSHYEITKGSVWIIPNLNFYSIIKRSRGPHGDMNRKFAALDKDDPDYEDIQRIKNYIKSPEVKLVLNLHDGSGYYRKTVIDSMHAPYRWGQSSIIDQANIEVEAYGNLEEIANRICKKVNENLLRDEDIYHVHNTMTKMGDKEMEKTLTYFAINNGKAAFGNEATKQLPVHERAYYHLLALEEYMNIMGIEFKRKFNMEPLALKEVIDDDIYMTFYDEKIKLPLSEVRNYVKYFPIKKDGTIDFKPSSPVMTIIRKDKKTYTIHYGNRELAVLTPDFLDVENERDTIKFKIDGEEQHIEIGSLIDVDKDFFIFPNKYRVNVIGYVNKAQKNESGLNITKDEIMKRFSVDKNGNIYRVEFYGKNDNKFTGMVMVKFKKKEQNSLEIVSNERESISNKM